MKQPRHPLNMARPVRVQCCLFCGREFPTQAGNALYCSVSHKQAEWRAVAMLAGTHGWDGRHGFKKLDLTT